MLRLASDMDVHGDIVDGLSQRLDQGQLVRAQDALPSTTADPEVLAWAAAQNRILISNDRKTMIRFASERCASGELMPGLIVTTRKQGIGSAIKDILLIAECLSEEEIRHQVVIFLPY
jgi:Domain of unknown function (DUF5615)